MKIATHNSCTGEKCKGLLSWLVTPFSKCQSKTLEEQFHAGCRMFDIRVKYDKNRNFVVRHGLWTCTLTFDEVLDVLLMLRNVFYAPIYVRVMYEGNIYDDGSAEYFITEMRERTQGLVLVDIYNKHPYKCLWSNPRSFVNYKEAFVGLPVKWGRWEWLLPFPWLWKKMRYDKPTFNDDCFMIVDFL